MTEQQEKILIGIYKVAKKMREHQAIYLRDKSRSDLAEANALGKRLDAGIQAYEESLSAKL